MPPRYRVFDRNSRHARLKPNKVYFAHFANTGGSALVNAITASQSDYHFHQLTVGDDYEAGDASYLKKKEKAFYSGHNLYGLAENIGQDVRYCTLLRHPCERIVSDFFWVNRYNSRYENLREFPKYVDRHDHLEFYIPRFAKMEEFRLKSSVGQHHSEIDSSTPQNTEILHLAYSNLDDRFWFVGITEEFDQSIFLFARDLGLPGVAPWSDKPLAANPLKPAFFSLPTSLRKKIEVKTEREIELYEHYRSKHEARFAETNFGEGYQLYLDYFHVKRPSGKPVLSRSDS